MAGQVLKRQFVLLLARVRNAERQFQPVVVSTHAHTVRRISVAVMFILVLSWRVGNLLPDTILQVLRCSIAYICFTCMHRDTLLASSNTRCCMHACKISTCNECKCEAMARSSSAAALDLRLDTCSDLRLDSCYSCTAEIYSVLCLPVL